MSSKTSVIQRFANMIDNFYPLFSQKFSFSLLGRVPDKPLLPNKRSGYFLAGRGHAQISCRGSETKT